MLESNQHANADAIARDRYSVSTSTKFFLSETLSLLGSIRGEKISDMEALQLLPAGSIIYL
jgi:hypothetical protein